MGFDGAAQLLTLPDGRRAQWWQGGAATGPAVFFHHGCPDTRQAAYPGEPAARRAGVRLLAVNRPGYGASDPADSDHLSVSDDTVAIADALGIDRFAVLGMSIGGQYALACAARHPARVVAVAAVATPAEVPALDPPVHRDDLAPEQASDIRRMATSSVEENIEHARPGFEAWVAAVAPDDPDDGALAERFTAGLPSLDAALLSTWPVSARAASVREALAQTSGYLRDAAVAFRPWAFRADEVECTARLYYGDLDPQVSLRNGTWLARHLPGATLVVRRGSAHLTTLHGHWDELLTDLRDVSTAGGLT